MLRDPSSIATADPPDPVSADISSRAPLEGSESPVDRLPHGQGKRRRGRPRKNRPEGDAKPRPPKSIPGDANGSAEGGETLEAAANPVMDGGTGDQLVVPLSVPIAPQEKSAPKQKPARRDDNLVDSSFWRLVHRRRG